MEISLLHRLWGAWLGFRGAIALEPRFSAAEIIALDLWQALLGTGDWPVDQNRFAQGWLVDPLENALALLPVLLFYHEDPGYLGDRLGRCGLRPAHLNVVQDIGLCMSDCLREKVTLGQFGVWLGRRSPQHDQETALLESIYYRNKSWRDYQRQLSMSTFTPTAQQLLQLYGAILWSGGHVGHCQRLLGGCGAVVQVWGHILLGCLRGDRQSHQRNNPRLNHHELRADVVAFWSRWSGLPPTNQLRLEQFPVIANAQGLKPRASLQLISQRHLT
ncbi:hypothetical protein [[Limnothrix rosea] IAM M-220]|uniref:hypothetical protein n=1 Tax=[Limnothrix rosea] IAM M-220 TaxID=454133 RepID=UPI00095C9A9A|nr:hypothetical protein [[Limnothrix rosea] IAM M-220]OKH14191.1 hypothetical protein NIES208_14185 [[Limnothrix rosea] IAM M-220]